MNTPVFRVIAGKFGDSLVAFRPEGLYFREKGRRTTYCLPWGLAFQRAVALTVDSTRAEKGKRRAQTARRRSGRSR